MSNPTELLDLPHVSKLLYNALNDAYQSGSISLEDMPLANEALRQYGFYRSARRAQPEGEAPQAEQRAVIEEAAQVFESGAAHNRKAGRTVFAHAQQDRADRLRAALTAPAAQHAECGICSQEQLARLDRAEANILTLLNTIEHAESGAPPMEADLLARDLDAAALVQDDKHLHGLLVRASVGIKALAAQSQGAQATDENAAAKAWADENVSPDVFDPAVEAFGAGASWRAAQQAAAPGEEEGK